MLASASFDGWNLTRRLNCDKGVTGGKKWSFLEEFPSKCWFRSSLGYKIKNNNQLRIDIIIGRWCRRSWTTANVARVKELICSHTWRPLACHTFIKIKLASCYLLLYVVYTCQKSFNFIDAFHCYKQKCKPHLIWPILYIIQ